jgi:hypothetical protein
MTDNTREGVQAAIAQCEQCGMPVRVVFTAEGEIDKVFTVCGHVKKPGESEASR